MPNVTHGQGHERSEPKPMPSAQDPEMHRRVKMKKRVKDRNLSNESHPNPEATVFEESAVVLRVGLEIEPEDQRRMRQHEFLEPRPHTKKSFERIAQVSLLIEDRDHREIAAAH